MRSALGRRGERPSEGETYLEVESLDLAIGTFLGVCELSLELVDFALERDVAESVGRSAAGGCCETWCARSHLVHEAAEKGERW